MLQDSSDNSLSKLECIKVSKSFSISDEGLSWRILLGRSTNHLPHIHALNQISLRVPKGEIAGILGHNGAGKSTLLRTLGGVYSPTSGLIKVSGDLTGLFELGGGGNAYLTGRECANRLLTLKSVSRKAIPTMLKDIKEFSELEDYFDRPIRSYSSGMASRLYFSIATAIPHDVYLIDEILSVGDEHFQNKCWLRMRGLLGHGASGLLVTHDWSAVIKLCRTAHIIEKGSVVFSGQADIAVAKYLNLQRPDPDTPKFSKSMSTEFNTKSGEDFEAQIPVDFLQDEEVLFGYSIELLRLGIGWEILLMSDPKSIAVLKGRHQLRLRIPRLPLSSGEYSLNLFLSSSTKKIYDVRSWTYGNALKLMVSGHPETSLIGHLAANWKIKNV